MPGDCSVTGAIGAYFCPGNSRRRIMHHVCACTTCLPHLLPTPLLAIVKCLPWQGMLAGQGACTYHLWPFCLALFSKDSCALGQRTKLDKDGFIICTDMNIDQSENWTPICKPPTVLSFLSLESLSVSSSSKFLWSTYSLSDNRGCCFMLLLCGC